MVRPPGGSQPGDCSDLRPENQINGPARKTTLLGRALPDPP